jgi:hypothetical protein
MFSLRKILVFSLFIVLAGCSYSESEKTRISSPDHKVDVVTTDIGTDATVATPTRIYIVPVGDKIKGEKPILIADQFKIKSIKWVGPKQLIISFYSGRIFQYENVWNSKDVDNFQHEIRVFLLDTNTPQ